MNHPINEFFKTSSSSLKDMANVNMIIGQSLNLDNGVSIIPVSKVKLTFINGGMENTKEESVPYGGASGGTVSLNPVCFIVSNGDDVKLLHVNEETHIYEKIIDEVPELIDSIKKSINKKNNNQSN